MATLVNLTPHDVNIRKADGSILTIQKSGQVARVDVYRKTMSNLTLSEMGINIQRPVFGNVIGLPEPKDGTAYIVSAMVRDAARDRIDVFSPGNLIRDDAGSVVGCDGLDCN